MKDKSEIRVCRNKDCQKVLPTDYKYKYCEACRNQMVGKAKKGVEYAGKVLIVVATVTFSVIAGEKIKFKE